MNRNVQPTSGQTLESVFHILNAWHPEAAERLYVENAKRERVRIMVTGALFYVGAAGVILIARLLHCERKIVHEMVQQYEDAPRIIKDPWEQSVRNMAYIVRDEPDTKLHKMYAGKIWRGMPEHVKWALDPDFRQKIVVTGAMIDKLREVAAASPKRFEPGFACTMCRKLYRARLVSRLVRLTSVRKVPIIGYQITDKGLVVLRGLDENQQRRNQGDDPKGN